MKANPSRASFAGYQMSVHFEVKANPTEPCSHSLATPTPTSHRSTPAPPFTMTEEAPLTRSSQGSSRRTPKNVGYPRQHYTPAPPQITTMDLLTLSQMQPQQQLSQIEKSVTHLLVATKQLLGTLRAHYFPWNAR